MNKKAVVRWAAGIGLSTALLVPLFTLPAMAAVNGEFGGTGRGAAAGIEAELTKIREGSELSTKSLPEVIGSIIKMALTILGVLLVVFFVYAGFLWTTAQGEKAQIDKAKELMKQTTIGLLITLASYSISEYVLNAILKGTA